MRPRAFAPPCLPGSGPLPGLAVPGRGDLFPAAGSVVGRRVAPAGRSSTALAVDGPSAAADVPPPEITWQIVVGAVAGVTPFVVAGVEFGKRIVAQKKCEICGGSGLVMKKDYYVVFFRGSHGEDSSQAEDGHVTP
uniref:Uncharacterized protein n=1 Tax=Leersia perrieri TaxID=77586 RepID=A0A0D9V5Z7_9ORYZ